MLQKPNAMAAKTSKRQFALVVLSVLLILLGTYHYIFSLAAFALIAVMLVFEERAFVISTLFLIMPLANIFKISPESSSLFTYIELLYVVLHIYRKKFRMTYGELLAVLFFGYIFIAGNLFSSANITRTIKLATNLMLIAYLAEVDIAREHKRLFLCYIIGIIMSSLLSFMDSDFFQIANYVTEKRTRVDGTLVGRFAGLYADPNYYAVNVIIAMCLTIILYRRRELNFPITLSLLVPLAIFAGLTGSKSSLLMLTVPIFFVLYVCAKNRNYVALIASFLCLCTIIILVIQGEIGVFAVALQRIQDNREGIGTFTTGRFAIWQNYLRFLGEHPVRTILGTGASIDILDGRASHNTYIDLFYQLGILGTVLYLISMYYCVRKMKRNIKRNLANVSVLITIGTMYFFLSELLYFDLPFHILLACMVWNLET